MDIYGKITIHTKVNFAGGGFFAPIAKQWASPYKLVNIKFSDKNITQTLISNIY